MRYTKFEIKNYKGIKALSLDLSRHPKSDIFTLVGLNESGKTTILEAINLFINDLDEEKRHILIPKSQKANFNGNISVKASLTLGHDDEQSIKKYMQEIGFFLTKMINDIKIEKTYKFENSKFIEKYTYWTISLTGKTPRGKIERELYSNSDLWQNTTSYIKRNLLPEIIYYPNFLFEFPPRIYLEEFPGETEEQPFYRMVLQDILDSLNDKLNLDTHIIARLKSVDTEDIDSLESTINKMGARITNVVFSAWSELFDSSNKEIVLKPGFESQNDRHYIEVKLKEGAEQYQISERSLGFKWFFSFLLFTEFRKHRDENIGEILFLLDEPASNLHSTAQKKLLTTFGNLVTNCRLIYATHSHHLINPIWLAGAFIVRNKSLVYDSEFDYDSSMTDIEAVPYRQFVSDNPKQTTYFQPILDALEYQPGLLEEVPGIIIVEGKNDYYTFRYINEIVLDNKYKDLRFYPGAGASKNSMIISLYLAWGRDFTILLDSDTAGKRAKTTYLRNFGSLVNNEIFILSDINKSWGKNFETEDLFVKNDQMKIINTLFENVKVFDKSKFNTALQNLYYDKKTVSLNKITKNRFSMVFKFLKELPA